MVNDPNGAPLGEGEVSFAPTKALFVEMLTRDIALDLAITDLVDNSVDGARRMRSEEEPLDGLWIEINLSADQFSIYDNCGGIDLETARNRAFRFGRKRDDDPTPHSVGQFGVGMKRALFKFGRNFRVMSITPSDHFVLEVDVEKWEREDEPWRFTFADWGTGETNDSESIGTRIEVGNLREDARNNFGRQDFVNNLVRTIEQAQQRAIERGLSIKCNGINLTALPWGTSASDDIKPGHWQKKLEFDGRKPVDIRIIVGIDESSPQNAGWYVSCNGRIVVSADQTKKTGWSLSAEKVVAPKYHNQFARFRGYVFFNSEDASLLPWNTTKDDIDQDSAIYQTALTQMIAMMRPVIDFLNAVDAEDPDAGVGTPLNDALRAAPHIKATEVVRYGPFESKQRQTAPAMGNISFSKRREEILALQSAMNATSFKDVGIKCFDLAYDEYVAQD